MKPFRSPTFGQLDFEQVVGKIAAYMEEVPDQKYRVVIGTDSQMHNRTEADFVSAVIVHRVGRGGIYFWQREKVMRPYALRERIYEEATRSMSLAEEFLQAFKDRVLEYDLEIHVDVGRLGETRQMINEVVGMIRGSGFKVKIKPEAYGAQSVADRYT
jgi:predicted RNase H-related nuclease YkuK (DUF458 family)